MLVHSRQLFKLLIRGQTRLVKTSLLCLPLILIFIFMGYFTTQNLLQAFEKQMHNSYFGVFGELQIASQKPFLEAIAKAPALSHLDSSFRVTKKAVYLFKGSRREILKGVEVIAYRSDYLTSKFIKEPKVQTAQKIIVGSNRLPGLQGNDSDAKLEVLILSSVVANQLDSQENHLQSIFNPKSKLNVLIENQSIIDFGFLGAKPIIVMAIKDLVKLNGKEVQVNQLEFNQLGKNDIELIETVANKLMLQGKGHDYQIINPKELNQEAQQVFSNINIFKDVFFVFLIVICCVIYFLAIKLLFNAKQQSLTILEYLGISRFHIVLNLFIFLLISVLISLLIGLQLAEYIHPFMISVVELTA